MKDLKQYVYQKAQQAAYQAWSKYMHNNTDKCYLYYDTGILQAVQDNEKTDLKLALNEHLPRNLTIEQLTNFIIHRIGQVPFLP